MVPELLWEFMQQLEAKPSSVPAARFAQGLYGYTCYDAVQFFDSIKLAGQSLKPGINVDKRIPLMRYRLYQYVIAFNHFKDELFICENKIAGLESDINLVESLIRSKDVPVYPFKMKGKEQTNMSDDAFRDMVKKEWRVACAGMYFRLY